MGRLVPGRGFKTEFISTAESIFMILHRCGLYTTLPGALQICDDKHSTIYQGIGIT